MIYMRFKTRKSWTFSWSLELISSWWCSSFWMTLSNIWSMTLRLGPKCWMKMPSIAALTWLIHSLVSMGPWSHVGPANSILSMLKFPFSSTNCLISDGVHVMYKGKLKESTSASLTSPCHKLFQLPYLSFFYWKREKIKKKRLSK